MYISDIVNISNLLHLILFADDTKIFMHHKNLEKLVEILNEALKLTNWFVPIASLNVKKTNFIIFCSPQKIYKRDDVNKILNGNAVEQISQPKFLGIYIDEYLNGEEHIKKISAKVSKVLVFFGNSNHF